MSYFPARRSHISALHRRMLSRVGSLCCSSFRIFTSGLGSGLDFVHNHPCRFPSTNCRMISSPSSFRTSRKTRMSFVRCLGRHAPFGLMPNISFTEPSTLLLRYLHLGISVSSNPSHFIQDLEASSLAFTPTLSSTTGLSNLLENTWISSLML